MKRLTSGKKDEEELEEGWNSYVRIRGKTFFSVGFCLHVYVYFTFFYLFSPKRIIYWHA